jgi:DNA-binding CsgD family transcriptional regulator/tetratricopeptide (TPR) repeat protein
MQNRAPKVETALLEREDQLARLQRLAVRCVRGQGQIVIVNGEAGIGKTSLLRAFADIQTGDIKVLWGGCEALFTPRTLGPLQDMAQKLGSGVVRLFDDLAPQDRLFPAVMRALDEVVSPHILIFEDVHWADNATLDLIKYLGRRIGTLRAMLILSVRADEVGTEHPWSQVVGDLPVQSTTRIDLPPLSASAVDELARRAGRGSGGLHELTSGNPFFVTELLARAGGSDVLPRSLRDAVWSRLARLPVEERELLELISINPGVIEPWLVRVIGGPDAADIVERCVERGLLARDVRGGLHFRHELARIATLERIPVSVQRALHGRIDSAMEQRDPQRTEIPFAVRMHHANGAADWAKVIALAPLAARQAARMGAHREAARHLDLALQHVGLADKQLAAELYEDWSYEAGIAVHINDDIITARKKAIALWRELGRFDKVSLNLRWLSRLHWYRGESELAARYIDEALMAVENSAPSAERAMVYSALSQRHMLHDRTDEAISWGERAIALADQFNVIETRIHALNNVGSALMFSGRGGGKPFMEESLALALEHGFHEQAARAYTNYAEFAMQDKDFALAERLLAEGIAFDTRHDLDSWTYYLIGRQAQLLMERGKLREAETVARGVLQREGQTLVMKLPALMVLSRTALRLGLPDSGPLLQQAMKDAMATGEPQYVSPARLALVEQAYITSDTVQALEQLHALANDNLKNVDSWERGEFAVWRKRFRLEGSLPFGDGAIARPRQLELDGQIEAAGHAWLDLGLPFEAALSLMQSNGPDAGRLLSQAANLLSTIGASPVAALARRLARKQGVALAEPKRNRGPYKAARSHPLGLTAREQQILGLIAQGMGNGEIAQKLVRSQRTIEHHVSAVLSKLNAHNRVDVVLRLRNEPWLLMGAESQN